MGYSRGAREPGSLEICRLSLNFCSYSPCFGANLASWYFCISCQMKKFSIYHTTCRKYFLVTGRYRQKLLVTGRNVISELEISRGSNFLWQEKISLESQKYSVKGRKLLVLEEISCHRKKLLFTALLVNGWVGGKTKICSQNFSDVQDILRCS